MDWQPIETAPRDGSQFLATNGILLGVGYHHRREEPPTIRDSTAWDQYYKQTLAGAELPGMGIMDKHYAHQAAWEKAKSGAPARPEIPNPKAGHVDEWNFAWAFHAFDGETETQDYDGPVSFEPTHWQPLPEPPASADTHRNGQDAEERLGS